ncbi:MAG: toll/interleukin-1 receptor domain-containing protein [Clostridia bacterium]|nr:toll/interleukin-1 receptor domain-containing protein [Clostridia bacterium]
MLYIIYGLTLDIGKVSRAYFEERGIPQIEKITFETENTRVQPSHGILHRAERESEVRACDYVYENHGRLVGFTAAQIERAVNGGCDAYLTFSSEDLSFLREIKEAYGDHVAIIYACIEDVILRTLTNALKKDESEKIARLEMGETIKRQYLAERELFDETVYYAGEHTAFHFEALKHQYAHIIKKYKEMEKELVPLPYKGTLPYVFVSYARADTDKVLPYLRLLQKKGCRIWYDKGIRGGDNWMSTLALKIKNCSQYLLFSSQASTQSVWTAREVSKAIKQPDISILTVRMDNATFDDGIEWVLEDYQQLFTSHEDFEEDLLSSIREEVIEHI